MSAAKLSKPAPPPLALNVRDACLALGISWKTWRDHVEPEIRIVRLGSAKRVSVAELQRYLDQHAQRVLPDEESGS
jgi:hypothetical protein